jgi:galactokinase
VPFPRDWRLIVTSSGVHADKAGTVRDRYNRASRLASALLAIWNARVPEPAVSLRAALSSAPDAVRLLQHAIEDTPTLWPTGAAGADLFRRLEHFVKEDARGPLAADAVARRDLDALGVLAAASQDDAVHLLGNQVPETETLVAHALEAGAPAASSFGAGFGGSAWAVVPAERLTGVASRWIETYRQCHPQLARVEQFTGVPSPPLLEIS